MLENFLIILMTCIVATIFVLIIFFKIRYTYWQRRGVPFLTPSIPFGNFSKFILRRLTIHESCFNLHRQLKSKGHKYGGLFYLQTPVFMPLDPAHIKQILVTDFQYFSERGTIVNEETDPLNLNLFNMPTEQWHKLRVKLSPAFTSGKLKTMFHTMVKTAHNVIDICDKMIDEPINISDITTRYTLDVIFNVAFGLECNSVHNPNISFKKIADKITIIPVRKMITFITSMLSPQILKYLNCSSSPTEYNQFFLDIVTQNLEFRETNNIAREDFLQLLINMMKEDENLDDSEKIKMTPLLIASQTFLFLVAGFDTSSSTARFCLYELSKNQQIQETVRTEIKNVLKKHDGEITYEGIKEMKYLDQVLKETLRKYPPLTFLNRECVKKYKLPDTDVVLEKGTKILVSPWALQMDPEYFPEPEKFDPERFSDENKNSIPQFTNLPFGEGPRICIGSRFGQMQIKVVLAALLSNYKFTLNLQTNKQFIFRKDVFVLQPSENVLLKINKLIN